MKTAYVVDFVDKSRKNLCDIGEGFVCHHSSSPTLARMIFCSLVIVGVLSKRRSRALRTPATPRPGSASASAMTPTVRLSLNYCISCYRPPAPKVDLAGRSDSIAFGISPRVQRFRLRLPI